MFEETNALTVCPGDKFLQSTVFQGTDGKLLWGRKLWPGSSQHGLHTSEKPQGQLAPPHQLNRILGEGDQIQAS